MRGSTAAARLLAAGLVACTALAATAVSAGAGDDRLTRAEFNEAATKECDKLLAASEELGKAQAPGARGARVAKYLRKASDGLIDLVEGLDDLVPPKKLEADADELIDVLEGYAEGLDTLADRVKRKRTFRELLADNPDLVARLNGIAERATGIVTRLGLTGCLLPT